MRYDNAVISQRDLEHALRNPKPVDLKRFRSVMIRVSNKLPTGMVVFRKGHQLVGLRHDEKAV